MRKILFGVIITLVVLFTFKYCGDKKNNKTLLKENSALIQEQINHVGKLIVTEGHFSEVFNYKNSKAMFGDLFSAEKKALIVVNAEVTVAYDLSKIKFEIDQTNKILKIIEIPDEDIKINPDLEYYDIQADYLNPFDAKDYNEIKRTINKSLLNKIEKSDLKANAKNRLISELAKFYILTNSMGWTLQFNQTPITSYDALQNIAL
ncbi:DUF4230 domain-containing protein [Algibacter sp. PT7-4]|uniref:DUF4230 domain-containing protein n=1 Tax=Algibacter ulvanivorans TaxID=3400999 RepID=UPI003AAEFC03